MKKVTKKSLMLLLKSVLVIALFSVIVFNMYTESAHAVTKKYSTFDWDNFKTKNEQNWKDYCANVYNEQGEEAQKECFENLTDSLEKFYKKLYKLLAKYQDHNPTLPINDQVILWTVFYGQYLSPVSQSTLYKDNLYNDTSSFAYKWSNGYYGFNLDNSDGSDEQIEPSYTADAANYYATETDTLKTLIRNAVAYTTKCYGTVGDVTVITAEDGTTSEVCEEGGSVSDVPGIGHKCADNQSYEMGFWKFFVSRMEHEFSIPGIKFLGFVDHDEHYDECMAWKDTGKYEDVKYVYEDDPSVSYEMYFDFLRENAYFDGKANLQYFFQDVLYKAKVDCLKDVVCENSLESKGDEEYLSYMEDIRNDRLNIIYEILEILDDLGIGIQYGNFTPRSDLEPGNSLSDRKAYYWPIGSDTTEVRDGVTYADGEPASTTVKSYYGERVNEVTKKKEMHTGIDIVGTNGVTNVVAVEKGEVITVIDNCTTSDKECNSGYGNMIVLSHSDGNYTVYSSLASIDSSVTVGASVQKGQVIGKVGATGRTNSSALHFEIRENGNSVENCIDPMSIINPKTSRPSGFKGGDFSMRTTTLTREEFIAGLVNYCNQNKCNPNRLGFFSQQAGKIYDAGKTYNMNPEFTVVRAILEGFSPNAQDSSYNNYWGIGCANGKGIKACTKYGSFDSGLQGLSKLGIVTKYNSALELFTIGHYGYIGSNWYKGGSADGGCYYFPYIKQYYTNQSRVATVEAACANANAGGCSGTSCLKTNDEDQEAYGLYNISGMSKWRYNIWGL